VQDKALHSPHSLGVRQAGKTASERTLTVADMVTKHLTRTCYNRNNNRQIDFMQKRYTKNEQAHATTKSTVVTQNFIALTRHVKQNPNVKSP
jgi:hypothetical protein